mmetsp:Transcript_32869/g.36412  ORF Transcript_32869/g.36412 Transcript_32869/m.36412 type:complete len:208 (-) Transcript_32869:306-929(-)
MVQRLVNCCLLIGSLWLSELTQGFLFQAKTHQPIDHLISQVRFGTSVAKDSSTSDIQEIQEGIDTSISNGISEATGIEKGLEKELKKDKKKEKGLKKGLKKVAKNMPSLAQKGLFRIAIGLPKLAERGLDKVANSLANSITMSMMVIGGLFCCFRGIDLSINAIVETNSSVRVVTWIGASISFFLSVIFAFNGWKVYTGRFKPFTRN